MQILTIQYCFSMYSRPNMGWKNKIVNVEVKKCDNSLLKQFQTAKTKLHTHPSQVLSQVSLIQGVDRRCIFLTKLIKLIVSCHFVKL